MKFNVQYTHIGDGYYIEMNNEDYRGIYYCDDDIVECINRYIPITLNEYYSILQSNGAFQRFEEYYFKNEEDANKTAEILNTKYAVVINLMGY